MTIGQEMLQAAKRGAASLDSTFANQIMDRVQSLAHPDGGYRGRSTASDLYYTVFTLKTILSLNADLPINSIEKYLRSFDQGKPLDLVHLSCLARCWSILPGKAPSSKTRRMILDRVGACRTRTAGFANQPGEQKSTIYHSFMAFSVYQDLEEEIADRDALIEWLLSREAVEEGFARTDESTGLTPVTSGAMVLLKHLNASVPENTVKWLRNRCCKTGGFLAASLLPFPDLLSTATAIHALSILHIPMDEMREACMNFVNTLRREGGFCGMSVEDTVDCEYTFYGLLSLGNLVQ